MKLSLPDILAYSRLPLLAALVILAILKQPHACFFVLLLTITVEVAQRTLARRPGSGALAGGWALTLAPYAEAALYVAVPVVFVRLFPAFLRSHLLVIALLIAAYLVTELTGYFKFHRLTSYQTHGSRLAGIGLGLTGLTLFWTTRIDWLLYASLAAALAAFAEEVLITLELPQWRAGVSSLWHARRIARRAKAGPAGALAEVAAAAAPERAERPARPAPPGPGGRDRKARKGGGRKSGR